MIEIYRISIFNSEIETVIHYPTSDKSAPHLLSVSLDEKLGQINHLSFNIGINNPGYNKIFQFKTLVRAINLKTNKTVFEGRVYDVDPEMDSDGKFYKEVTCESEIAFLDDTRVRLWNISNMSNKDFVAKVAQNHNAHTTQDKQFQVGNVMVEGTVTCTTDGETSLDILQNKLSGGYLFVRKENGVRYLDYLPQDDQKSDDIVLAHNMKDMLFTPDVSNLGTRLIPYGKDGLDIASVNGGLDYIKDAEAENMFGSIEQTAKFDDIADTTELMTAGQNKLKELSMPIYKLTSNILDLSTIGIDQFGFYVGSYTNIKCQVIGFEQSFLIVEKNTDLLNPQNCQITLGDKQVTSIQMQLDMQKQAAGVQNNVKTAIVTANQAESTANTAAQTANTANANASTALKAVDDLQITVGDNTKDLTTRVTTLETNENTFKDGIKANENSITLNYSKFVALMDKLATKNVITQDEENIIKNMTSQTA